jgi:hypothetical protein
MNHKLSIALACALLGTGALCSSGAEAAEPVGAKTAKAEFTALQARATKLASNTSSPAWQQLLKDFDAWAAKYGAQTQTESVAATAQAATGAPGGAKHPCKPYFQNTPGFFCTLDPDKSTATVCYYKCTKY